MAASTLQFIGNATTLIRCGPFTLLTDPNFLHQGEHAYLGYGLLSRRLTEPALTVDELPPIDAVVLSHLHGDHWDRRARRGIDSATPVVTTPQAARRLQAWQGFRRAVGLRTGEKWRAVKGSASLSITSLPGRHAPLGLNWLLPPVMGSLVDYRDELTGEHFNIYISGDTLMFAGIGEIARRFPAIDCAVVHLGGTRLPGGVMVTMDADQGRQFVETVNPGQVIPVHYADYGRFSSGLTDFLAAMEQSPSPARITPVLPGETVYLTATPTVIDVTTSSEYAVRDGLAD